jgi:hypothetical protein
MYVAAAALRQISPREVGLEEGHGVSSSAVCGRVSVLLHIHGGLTIGVAAFREMGYRNVDHPPDSSGETLTRRRDFGILFFQDVSDHPKRTKR